MTTWKGYVYRRGQKLWIGFKQNGVWKQKPTPFHTGEEKQARALLARIRDKVVAGRRSKLTWAAR